MASSILRKDSAWFSSRVGQAIDQFGHRRAEAVDQVGLGDAAVLHGIVQQGRHEGLHVELPARAQRGHGDGVRDVGLSAAAQLAQVRGIGIAVCLAHLLDAGAVEVVELFQKRGEARRRGIGRCGG
jgi:hypothetical protein